MKNIVRTNRLADLFSMSAAFVAVSLTWNAYAGTDILHFTVKDKMTIEPAFTNAAAQLDLQYKSQGKVTVQTLDITAKKLTPNAEYSLVIPADPAVSNSAPVIIDEFTADKKGSASVRFRDVGHDNGKSNNLGKGKKALPSSLNPLTGVTNLAVVNAHGATVMASAVSSPDKLSYLVKRDLSTGNVQATFRLTANASVANLRLSAKGLAASASYKLRLNGGTPEVFEVDAKGRLEVKVTLEQPLEALSLKKVELLDATDVVILTTDLP